jgi:myo-inositol-1(or 4)-monophosphatase
VPSFKTDSETDDVFALALRLAEEAAALLLRRRGTSLGLIDTKTSVTDVVSDVDRASEDLMVDAIRSTRPSDGILAEEGTADSGTSGWRWVIDPLDGTVNYLYGLPAYAVSVAVEHNERPEVAVVVDPVHGETFAAVRGRGATLNGEPISVSDRADLALALVGTGFSYGTERRAHQAAILAQVLRPCATFAGPERRRSTCVGWPAGASTASTNRACSRGTSPPAPS